MKSDKDPRFSFCEFLAGQLREVEARALALADEYICVQESQREDSPSRNLSGLYLSVRREPRTGRIQIDWRRSKYKDNSPLSMRSTGRQFVKSEHVHRCPTATLGYSRRNIKTAVRYGAQWEFELVWSFEKRAAILRKHAIDLEELKKTVVKLLDVAELPDLNS